MKKNVLISLLFLIFFAIGFFPFERQKTTVISAPFLITIQQLLQPENWKKWQPEMNTASQTDSSALKISKRDASFTAQKSGLTVTVNHVNGFGFNVEKNIDGQKHVYNLIAIPNDKTNSSLIISTQKTSLLSLLWRYFDQDPAKDDVDFLKNFLEDPRLYYGFDIKKTTVTDSNIVVQKKTVPSKNKAAEYARIEQELKDFVKENDLKIAEPIVADIRNIGNDSTRIMIGLPVNRQTISAGKIQFMRLPPHGRMLTGIYTGKYGGRQKLYNAMKAYISDHSLASPEDPYEKYLDNKIPVNDTDLVHLQVNFPIY